MQYTHHNPQPRAVRRLSFVVMPLLLILLFFVVAAVLGAPGNLDQTFGESGMVQTFIGGAVDTATEVVIQEDGKIVVAGSSFENGLVFPISALVRYESNGDLDGAFADQGVASPFSTDGVGSMVIQDDGKILVAGSTELARYQSSGQLDSSFGVDGIASLDLSSYGFARDMAVQGDGKIVLAGSQQGDNGYQLLLVRYNNDGVIDTTFGSSGQVISETDRVDISPQTLTVQHDGRILIAGSSNSEVALARYDSDGTLDTSFGLVTTTVTTEYDSVVDMALQVDGKIVVAGRAGDDVLLARYLDTGQLDTEFGAGGIVTADLGEGEHANAVLIQPDGRIVVVADTPGMITLLRYDSDGSFDSTFGTDGIVNTEVTNEATGNGLALQEDGAIVVVGRNAGDFAVLRYTDDGSLDAAFGANGIVETDLPYNDRANAVAAGPDGRIVAAGTTFDDEADLSSNEGADDIAVVSYDNDGDLTSEFGDGGVVTLDLGGDERANAVVVQPDGKVLVAGEREGYSGQYGVLLRFAQDGSLDVDFGWDGTASGYIASPIEDMVLQDDGKIVVVAGGIIVARYHPDGTLDNAFGNDGIVTTDLNNATVEKVVVTPEGDIVVAGTQQVIDFSNNDNSDLFLARYKPDGTLDDNFGENGVLTVDEGGSDDSDRFAGLLVQPGGRLLLLHYLSNINPSDPEWLISGYQADGVLDESFGVNGVSTQSVAGNPHSMALQADHKIVAVGGSGNDYTVLRLLEDGAPDPDFDVVTTPLGDSGSPSDVVIQLDHKIVVGGGSGGKVTLLRYEPGEVRVEPSSLALTGPESGTVGTTYTFTTEVKPDNLTTPVTYLWETAGESPVQHQTNSITDTVSFAWDTVGTKLITVTVSNTEGVVTTTHSIDVNPPPPAPEAVSIQGPEASKFMMPQTFTATVSPGDVALPITYEWQATDHAPVTHTVDSMTDTIAFSWAITGTKQVTVAASNDDGSVSDSHTLTVEEYPALKFSTFLGTGGFDRIADITRDESGNIFVVGRTDSANFPLTPDAFDKDFGGSSEGFVAKFDNEGNLLFSSFLGGSDWDQIDVVEIKDDRFLYMSGETLSVDFPTTAGALDGTFNGGTEVFVVQYDLESSEYVFATYLGGSDHDFVDDMVVDESGNVVLSGTTLSSDFPTTTDAFDTSHASRDVFVSKIRQDGNDLIFSTFVGGDGSEFMTSVASDAFGNVFVTGRTDSVNFPTTSNALDSSLDGSHDAFVIELNSSGTELLYGTYLGGNDWDEGHDIEVTQDEIIVGGFARSLDFPVTAGSYDTTLSGKDVFVASLRRDYSDLNFSTFIGGSGEEGLDAILVRDDGEILVSGFTTSADFPVSPDGHDGTFNGGSTDVYLAKLSAAGDALPYATYLGGTDMEYSHGLLLGLSGEVVVAGDTESSDFPITPDAFDTTYNGGRDSYITAIQVEEISDPETVEIRGSSMTEVDVAHTFTATVAPTNIAFPVTYEWQATGQSPITHATNELTDTVSFNWSTPGVKEVTVTADNGDGRVSARHTIMVVEGEMDTVMPDEGGAVSHTGEDGTSTTVQVPGGAVTETTTLVYTPLEDPPADDELNFAGIAFDLDAYRDGERLDDFTFNQPVTVTVNYNEEAVTGIEESELKLYVQEGDAWVDAATTCTPPSTYARNLEENDLSVSICHLSRFALLGPDGEHQLFLPMLMR